MIKSFKLPIRKHYKTKWMSEQYHKRIQKKWNKRYGEVSIYFIFNSRGRDRRGFLWEFSEQY